MKAMADRFLAFLLPDWRQSHPAPLGEQREVLVVYKQMPIDWAIFGCILSLSGSGPMKGDLLVLLVTRKHAACLARGLAAVEKGRWRDLRVHARQ